MVPYYTLRVHCYDASNPSSKLTATNISVTLTFSGNSMTVLSNSNGLAVFIASSTINFVSGSSVTIAATDYQQILQNLTLNPTLSSATAAQDLDLNMIKEFAVKIILNKIYTSVKVPNLQVTLTANGANYVQMSNATGVAYFKAVNQNFDSSSIFSVAVSDPAGVYSSL